MNKICVRFLTAGLVLQLFFLGCYFHLARAASGEMSFFGTLIDPLVCTINGDNEMLADFGNAVQVDKIDGSNYMQKVNYKIECKGNAINALRMQLNGAAATFDNKAVKTGNTNLGIAIYNGSTRVGVNEWIKFTYPGIPDLRMAPVKNSKAALTPGLISGYVNMLLDYQ